VVHGIVQQHAGAITVASQMALSGARYEVVESNHFEELLSDHVVALIRGFVQTAY